MSQIAEKTYYEIKPPKGLVHIDLKEIWAYRELLYIFVWRDIKVRYKQTAVGVMWAIFQPFFTMLIFTIFFGRFAKMPSDGVPYPIFVYAGLLLWNYFSNALSSASDSLIVSEGIIKKVYFPRLILPLSTTVTPVFDFFLALVVLFGLMIFYHFTPHFLGIILIPLLLLISLLSAWGLGVFLASVNVKYRDVRYILPFFIQIMLFLTPVIYPISIIPAKYQWLIYLNPMAGVIQTARTTLLGGGSVDWQILSMSFGISLILVIGGIYFFRKTERFFADIL
ncbi:MAG: ABC transporter permease [Candidatus Berkelbacteria bacterium]